MASIYKTAKVVGVLSAVAALILWAMLMLTWLEYPEQPSAPITAAIMGVLVLGGALAALFERPFLMVVIFLFSFFPIGLYLLGVPSAYRLIGVFDLLYLLSAVVLLVGKYKLVRR